MEFRFVNKERRNCETSWEHQQWAIRTTTATENRHNRQPNHPCKHKHNCKQTHTSTLANTQEAFQHNDETMCQARHACATNPPNVQMQIGVVSPSGWCCLLLPPSGWWYSLHPLSFGPCGWCSFSLSLVGGAAFSTSSFRVALPSSASRFNTKLQQNIEILSEVGDWPSSFCSVLPSSSSLGMVLPFTLWNLIWQ